MTTPASCGSWNSYSRDRVRRKELLVPNKEFITGRLLNWTLSDTQTHVVIKVGIAYGSNVEQALQILHDVVSAHRNTLKEPVPLIVFENFDDNTVEVGALLSEL